MYNTANAYRVYETNNVTTASPKRLIIMLCDGAIRLCKLSEIAIREKNIEKKNEYLKRAQAILGELSFTLNFDAGEIANQLSDLYAFMMRELVYANIKMDAEKVKSVRELLEELREAWSEIV
ncbi:MAG: flagellar export chaperone FliS [Peptostreptococcaceae bacterium]|nr:flagellar export chaperone FliS [Peptostreptococcaceae bacterium]